MAIKRKFDADLDDASVHRQVAKQVKLVPFPSYEQDLVMDLDVVLSGAPLMDIDPTHSAFHSRFPSSASSDFASDASSPVYPVFNLYPASYPPSRASPSVSVQSSTLEFTHHRDGCKQIPKLRVACGAGPSGQRSMWAMCEECGAIQIVDS